MAVAISVGTLLSCALRSNTVAHDSTRFNGNNYTKLINIFIPINYTYRSNKYLLTRPISDFS